MKTKPGTVLKAGDFDTSPEYRFRHPHNPDSNIVLRSLGDAAGLERTAVMLGRIAAGAESFVYHSHERDEEFLYILSGRGRLEIDGIFTEIGPGDFVGFPTPSAAHHLVNAFEEDLVYLMCGERSGMDVTHFPRLGKTGLSAPSGFFYIEDAALQPFDFAAAFPERPPPSLAPAAGPSDRTRTLASEITKTVLDLFGDGALEPDSERIRDAVQAILTNKAG